MRAASGDQGAPSNLRYCIWRRADADDAVQREQTHRRNVSMRRYIAQPADVECALRPKAKERLL
ncbi:MAG: hypothetical protein A4S17_00630 [Proteobacteria bacterium HN_bin10]|nr:MAG: hypothetical protein A4S17_00630 [Proteobacteria bacterium HN_bin10]